MDLAEVLAKLTPTEAKRVEALREQLREVWMPDAENKPQQRAYVSEADVIGYGGAAGGGKTDLALGMALTRHRIVQFFRREGTEMGAIVDRAVEIVGHRDGLTTKPAVWHNPSPRCKVIEFCSVPHAGDEYGYKGRAKDLLVFDEATDFLESQVRFLMGWVRTTDPEQRCCTLMTFNPPTTPEGRWVIAFFAPWLDKKHPNPAQPGELRWFTTIAGKDREMPDARPFVLREGVPVHDFDVAKERPEDIIKPQSRTFIPSRVTDNSYLRSTGYIGKLQAHPEPLRSLMLHGDFTAATEDDPMQVIPTRWVEAAMARWKPLDPKPRMDSVGVDVAMKGRDLTVIARRHGLWFDQPVTYPGTQCVDGPTIASFVLGAHRDDAVIHIDLFGVGAQPYGELMRLRQNVLGINVGDPASGIDLSGRMEFFNYRSQLWWRMREALDPTRNNGIALPPDRRLLADLTAPTWQPQGRKIKVASREDLVDKIGRSPDFGSAYCLALIDTPALRAGFEFQQQNEAASKPYHHLDEFDRHIGRR